MRAIRGAITVPDNTKDDICQATIELLTEIAERNDLGPDEVISIFFSVTPDLNADFPARSARAMGWDVPMLDMQEMDVKGALARCIRVLIHTTRGEPARHAYLGGAQALRPDLEDPS